MVYDFSFIIPVYNRPNEVDELLKSFTQLIFDRNFEIVIVEDGSSIDSEDVVQRYRHSLRISYYKKENTGPGDSRNFGMQRAKGNYFIILDSDVILPTAYLYEVDNFLQNHKADFFGGPDAAHPDFSRFQKAVSYSMTSIFTTGGIRGREAKAEGYEPRSFNMGISLEAFEASGGFREIHPGEDPDLSIRLKKLGFTAAYIPNAVVYHKRRIDFSKFYNQVKKFGLVRPILIRWYPNILKPTYFFPSVFIFGLIISLIMLAVGFYLPVLLYLLYFLTLFVDASWRNKSILTGALAVMATVVQFAGYGFGFIFSFWKIVILKQNPEEVFPQLFFKNGQ